MTYGFSGKRVGYIIMTDSGAKRLGPENVTWLGDSITLFTTYESARNAVRRTLTYMKAHHYRWANMFIQKVMSV
jgi:hypothetical protein